MNKTRQTQMRITKEGTKCGGMRNEEMRGEEMRGED